MPSSIKIQRENDGIKTLSFSNNTSEKDIKKIKPYINENEIFELETKFKNYKDSTSEDSLSKRNEKFIAPQMMLEIQGNLDVADSYVIFEDFDWNLDDCANYKLEANKFNVEKRGNGFLMDLDNNSLNDIIEN